MARDNAQRKHRVSMLDIATAAHVSPSTASRALNGHPKVSDEARKAVLDAAEKLGYVRNLGAASLASSQSNTIGLLIRDVGNQFYGGLASHVQAETDRYGFDLLLATGGDSVESQMRAVRNLLGHGVGGIIIASGRVAAQVADYAAKFVPTVVLASGLELPSLNSVRIDPQMEAKLAHIVVDHGHRNIAVTASSDSLASALHARIANFLTELIVAGAETTIISLANDDTDIDKKIDEVLDSGATAIMAGNDSIALSVLEYLDSAGIACPGEVSVTGFDGIGPYRSSLFGLTTVEQPIDKLAHEAVKLMSRHLHDESPHTSQVLVRGRFIEGRTLGSVRGSAN
ncbi:LacI family transcription regulator [Bifidobacterium mongoliense DSM 21395]|uniref:LacI family transcription regulator n=2 Tax=Bifidobacterium mongoliense TaxID=518643 RepID=A0A087BVJ4_9BIFI|nr:LacI family transcription regulator [Bifidobacterium mongoliense DSM 21395]